MKSAILIACLVAILALSGWFAWSVNQAMPSSLISWKGMIALVAGIVLSVIIGGGLMALVYYSHRHGYDDAAHQQDPFQNDKQDT